jgi:hypothetical protein
MYRVHTDPQFFFAQEAACFQQNADEAGFFSGIFGDTRLLP